MFEIHVGELRATFLRNHNMRRHKDPSRRQPKQKTTQARKTTQADNSSSEDAHIPGNHHNCHKRGGAAPDQGYYTRYGALHPLRGAAPVTWRCTRTEEVHCLRIGCSAPTTRTNAELAHRTTHRHTPPCAPGPYWRQDGHTAHAAHAATCTPAHSDTSHTLTCEEPINPADRAASHRQ